MKKIVLESDHFERTEIYCTIEQSIFHSERAAFSFYLVNLPLGKMKFILG